MARRIQQQPLFVLIVAVVFVCSFWVVFARQPERVVAVSQDGVLKVEGVARDVQRVKLETLDASLGQYAFSVEGSSTLQEVVLSFPAQDVLSKDSFLFVFDRAQNQWIKEVCLYDEQERRYIAHVNLLGSTIIQLTDPAQNRTVDKEDLL